MEKLAFYLYVSGKAQSSEIAIQTVKSFIAEEVGSDCDLFIFDISEDPYLAEAAKILVTPTLIKENSEKSIRVVGNFNNRRKLLESFELEKVYG
ncbi:MAG TPA: circadian clock KaiB family protein [Leptospiraceae bacterium]|nr:circadian clock KaiB family protein [Leptospiraceae bacterium]HMW07741.1 circadian clock KaiB family protein [Leptospiraceae bacterium]HMX31989.1 circadian clock KaiB family protein [Leptospiraceae bacterium]HMY33407.1 circadian clock KaiB family protein [Leptospiraceae bacterium]HMZ64785.1 circadian clock KaiB family protein [Leptospiraceae bacterium]